MIPSHHALHYRRGQPLGFLVLTVLVSILALLSRASAQPPNSNFQWVVQDERMLYIQGGDAFGFFYSLDLSKLWDNTNPPWTALPNGPDISSHVLTVNRYGNGLALYAGLNTDTEVSTYDFEEGTWSDSVIKSDQSLAGAPGVLNPDDHIVYIPRRDWPRSNYIYSGAVWSPLRKSILMFGGRPSTGGASVELFYEYKPSTRVWSNITTTGVTPGPSANHCMVSAYSGTKLVVFGGYDNGAYNGVGVGSIHILDLTSMGWTAGTPVDPSQNRGNPACAVAGDSFVAWGGDNNGTRASTTPIIYNLRTNEWVTRFDPLPGGTPPPSSSKSSRAKRAGAIGGGVAAAIVLIGLFLYRRRLRKQRWRRAQGTRYQRPDNRQSRPFVAKEVNKANLQGNEQVVEPSSLATPLIAKPQVPKPEPAVKPLTGTSSPAPDSVPSAGTSKPSSTSEESKDHTIIAVASE